MKRTCGECMRDVRERKKDRRLVWHRDRAGRRKWCPGSPKFKEKRFVMPSLPEEQREALVAALAAEAVPEANA
jgi:hypothetical protein